MTVNLSNLLLGQKERPLERTEVSSGVRVCVERLMMLSCEEEGCELRAVFVSGEQGGSPGS